MTDAEQKAFAQGRAAGLEEAGQDLHSIIQGIGDGEWEELAVALCEDEGYEPYELIWTRGPEPEPWGDRWCKYEDDAKKMLAMVRKYSTISPTFSDAGKDDARDAVWMKAAKRVRDFLDVRETMIALHKKDVYAVRTKNGDFPLTVDDLRILSSLEVIGKGEKG